MCHYTCCYYREKCFYSSIPLMSSLHSHSFKTNPNSITNLFKLCNYIAPASSFYFISLYVFNRCYVYCHFIDDWCHVSGLDLYERSTNKLGYCFRCQIICRCFKRYITFKNYTSACAFQKCSKLRSQCFEYNLHYNSFNYR